MNATLNMLRPPKSQYKEKIRDAGLTQAIAAAYCGVEPARMSLYMNGYAATPERVERKLDELLKKARREAPAA